MTRAPAVRADLSDLAPYVSPQLPARVRLNTNESPHPPPREVIEDALARLRAASLNRYPDRDAAELVDALAGYAGASPESVWLANGSNEVLLHLFLAFAGAGRRVLVFEPTYSLHAHIARISGAKVHSLRRGPGFEVELPGALEAIAELRPEVVMLCSPNNPSGGLDPPELVSELLAAAPGIVVMDEAYGEFAGPGASADARPAERPNLVLVRTFSKAWGMAGVRLGYLLAAPAVIAELARVRLPYHLSTPAQCFGAAALARPEAVAAATRAVAGERDRLALGLDAMGFRTWPSHANFVLFEAGDAPGLWRRLLDAGVLVRSYPDRAGLERCLRVTAGLPDETDAFLEALDEVGK